MQKHHHPTHHSSSQQSNHFLSRLAAVLLTLIVLAALGVRPAFAFGSDRYVAKTGADTGNCSLNPCLTVAYAISQSGSDDILHLAAGTYTENLVLNKNLYFLGAGLHATILDGGGVGIVINSGSYNLFIQDLTIRNGHTPDGGGGISQSGGTLTLNRVSVTGNLAAYGGGILSSGPLTITDSVVSDNTASAGSGGGLFLQGSSVTENLTNVTISGNTAHSYSGGLHHQAAGSTLNLTNVTISGNTANLNGAMSNTNSATVNLLNTTLAGNHFSAGGANGGIGNYAIAYFKNTLLAGNDDRNCGYTGGATQVSLGHNLESGSTCNFTQPGDLQNTDPVLGPLADNGGPTQTHALLDANILHPRSPAIDAGTDTGCPGADQRGVVRPQGAHCDIGAFELGMYPLYLPLIWH